MLSFHANDGAWKLMKLKALLRDKGEIYKPFKYMGSLANCNFDLLRFHLQDYV